MRNDFFHRLATTAAMAIIASLVATGPARVADAKTTADSAKEEPFTASDVDSFSGAFLAGRTADTDHDAAAAINFYRKALEFDAGNREVRQRLMVTLFEAGRFDEGAAIAEQLKDDPDVSRITAIARGLKAIKAKDFKKAETILAYTGDNDLDRLMNGLLVAWAQFGDGKTDEALAAVKGLKGPDWFAIFRNYHAGAMAAAAGRTDDARNAFKAALTDQAGGGTAPDTYMAAVMALADLEVRAGNKQAALDAVATGDQFSPGYPPLSAVRDRIEAGKTSGEARITNAEQGAAAVMFTIGGALNREGAEEIVSIYLQMAHALDPNDAATLVMLGGIAETFGNRDAAIDLYRAVSDASPMRRLAEMQLGLNLADQGKLEEAKASLRKLIEQDPNDMRSYVAYGSILSDAKDYKAMAENYDRAVEAIGPVPTRANWNIFFQRGIAYERLKEWPKAEPNFLQALKLFPDQPQVLNYLGYSWIDMNMKLDEGMAMIRKAVDLRPNDGYIVDSLGWAHYRLGQFADAVTELERAIELKPEDVTINDHLGDAYWQVGRKLEAVFQWNRALVNKPEEADIARIQAKIKDGLPAPVNGKPVSAEADPAGTAAPAQAPETKPADDKKSEMRPAIDPDNGG